MAWLPVVLGAATCWILYRSDEIVLFIVVFLLTLISFWSWGIMHNFATEEAKKRPAYTGGFYDLTKQEARVAPDWITRINFVSSIGIALIFLYAVLSW